MCWPLSKGSSKRLTIDEEPNHQVMHLFRLGKAECAPHQPLNPGPQIDMLTLDFLGVVFARLVMLGVDMPLVSTPAIGVIRRDTKGFQRRFELQKNFVLASAKDLCQHRSSVMINGVPQPARIPFVVYITPPFVELGAQPSMHL